MSQPDRAKMESCRIFTPHWPDIKTYPHHKHVIVGSKVIVEKSGGGDLEAVLQEISHNVKI